MAAAFSGSFDLGTIHKGRPQNFRVFGPLPIVRKFTHSLSFSAMSAFGPPPSPLSAGAGVLYEWSLRGKEGGGVTRAPVTDITESEVSNQSVMRFGGRMKLQRGIVVLTMMALGHVRATATVRR